MKGDGVDVEPHPPVLSVRDLRTQILDLMRQLREELGMAIILITHDLGVVAEMVEQVVVMYAGKIVERADVATLFREGRHPYTEGLLGSLPDPAEERDELLAIEGVVPSPHAMPDGCRFHPRCPYAQEICWNEEPPLHEFWSGHEAACFRYSDFRPMPDASAGRGALVMATPAGCCCVCWSRPGGRSCSREGTPRAPTARSCAPCAARCR